MYADQGLTHGASSHLIPHGTHTHTKDPYLAILRDRLAEADHIASVAAGGHTQVPLITPLPHCGDDFPIHVDNSYSDDNVKALLDRLARYNIQNVSPNIKWKISFSALSHSPCESSAPSV